MFPKKRKPAFACPLHLKLCLMAMETLTQQTRTSIIHGLRDQFYAQRCADAANRIESRLCIRA